MNKQIRKSLSKILIIRNDKIGDLILSSGIFSILSKEFPNAKITAIVSNENFPIVENNKNISRIIKLKSSPRKFEDFIKYYKISKEIKEADFDLGIDLRGSFFNTLFLLYLGKVKKRIGFYEQGLSRIFLSDSFKRDKSKHEIDLIKNMINSSLDLNIRDIWPDISVNEKDNKAIEKYIKINSLKKFICINPDSSIITKQLSLDKFDEVIKFIRKRFPTYKIILAGVDESKINYLKGKNPYCILFIRRNLRELYLLLKNSSLVIAPDGGVMHLAWSAKSPVIAFIPKYIVLDHIKPRGKNIIIYKNFEDIKTAEITESISEVLS